MSYVPIRTGHVESSAHLGIIFLSEQNEEIKEILVLLKCRKNIKIKIKTFRWLLKKWEKKDKKHFRRTSDRTDK